jgi:hypothetical protein
MHTRTREHAPTLSTLVRTHNVVCAGQIDALAEDFVILDWKRVENDLTPSAHVYKYGAHGIPDTKYHQS